MAETTVGMIPMNANKGVFVDIYDDGSMTMTLGGKPFYLLSDTSLGKDSRYKYDTKHPGIRPRWAVIVATSDHAEECGLRVGMKVLCEENQWSVRPVVYERETGKRFWWIKAEHILLVDDDGLTEAEKRHMDARYVTRDWLDSIE